MDSKITINIVEPGSAPVVPDTGLFTAGIGGPEATIITAVSTVLLLTIVAVVVAMLYKKHKKQGKTTKLVSTVDACATVVKSKKRVSAGLAAVALLVSAGTFAGLLVNAGKSNTNAAEGEDGLTLDVSSEDFTIEVGSEPVFAMLPVELTVEEATQAGYTLTAFTDSTDLISTTDESKTIPMVVTEGDELAVLTDNTYGLSLAEPESKDSEVYTALSTDADAPTFITDKDHKATEAGDTTTIYYGFYITPDVPYGTYTGTNINYNVEPHYITNLSFNGNGNDGGETIEGMTIIAGDTITLPENTFAKEGYNFIGWNTVAEPTEQDPGEAYADQADFTAELGENKDVTLYAQWEEATLYMQDVAKWGSKLEMGDEIIAVDNRDNKEYYVARLADGNIWMTQNLDHNIGDIKGGTYTSTDTDLAYSSIGTTWTPSSREYTKQADDTSWTDSYTTPESYDLGELYWNGNLAYDRVTCEENGGYWNTPSYQNPYCSGNNTTATASAGNSHHYLGNKYNWTAAVAMSNSSTFTTDQQDVNQSICPAGWRLPTYNGDKSYQNLVSMQSLTAGISGNIQNSPAYFVYSGGILGTYWSSVLYGSDASYALDFYPEGSLSPRAVNLRNVGKPLRCVAR